MTVGLDDQTMQAMFDKLMRMRKALIDISDNLPMLMCPRHAAQALDPDIIELWGRLNLPEVSPDSFIH